MNRFYYNECFKDRTDASRIKVENIHGDVLLLAPKFDDTWPSDMVYPRIMKVLEEKEFPYRHECILYEKASHYLAVPSEAFCFNGKSEEATQKLLAKFMTMEEAYPEGCRKARQESWEKLVSFFKEW